MLNQADRPLYQYICEHSCRETERYHIPGHNGGLLFEQRSWQQIGRWDVTETYGMDDLHAPGSVIQHAQRLAAEAFGAAETWFLVNGTSCGVLAAIHGIFQRGDAVLVQRNAHKSIYNGLMLAGVHPRYLLPEVVGPNVVAGTIQPKTLRLALERHPKVKGVILTNPTYYGHLADMEELARLCREYDVLLFVDEAHGAHLRFHPELQKSSALLCGADIVVQSAHKTLPALTMAAMLHIGENLQGKIDRNLLAYYVGAFQTTSPSYLVMASLDYARHWMTTQGTASLADAFQRKRVLTEALESLGVSVSDGLWQRQFGCDPLKLTMDVSHTLYTGLQWEAKLAQRQIFVEMADVHHVLLLLTMGKSSGGDQKLLQAVKEILDEAPVKNISSKNRMFDAGVVLEPQIAISLGDCISRGIYQENMTELVPVCESLQRIVAEYVIPYPPGIPLLCPGEVIKSEHVAYLQMAQQVGVHFQGTAHMHIDRLRCFIGE